MPEIFINLPPARATQSAGYPAGQARVQVTKAGAVDLDTLEVCISRLLDNIIETHLDPRSAGEVWKTNFVWFRPHSPRLEGSTLLFDLQPSVTWHLCPHAPYVLRLRDAQGMRRKTRLTWGPYPAAVTGPAVFAVFITGGRFSSVKGNIRSGLLLSIEKERCETRK